MLVSRGDIALLCATLDDTVIQDSSKNESRGKSADRVVTLSSVCLLAFCACSYLQQGQWSTLLTAWLLLELAHFIYQRTRYEKLNAPIQTNFTLAYVKAVQDRFLSLSGVIEIQDFLRGWFNGADPTTIREGNLEDFVAYGFYTRTMEALDSKGQAQVRGFVAEVQDLWKYKLPPGKNPDLTFMAHLWEPLRVFPLPLALHLASETLYFSCYCVLMLAGFSAYQSDGFRYWIWRPQLAESDDEDAQECSEAETTPIFFLHGVGLGLLPYLGLLHKVHKACPQSPLILFDLPAVSMRLGRRAPEVDSIAAAAVASLHVHFPERQALFLAHSFGTFCASRICQLFPRDVHSVVLADPVCMMTCYPQLLANFVYKLPSVRTALSSPLGLANAIRWVLARELVIAETFCRKFLWHSLMLWPEDLPERAVILASCNDDLVPAELVQKQLKKAGSSAIMMLHPTHCHGGFLIDPVFQGELLGHISDLIHEPAKAKAA